MHDNDSVMRPSIIVIIIGLIVAFLCWIAVFGLGLRDKEAE